MWRLLNAIQRLGDAAGKHSSPLARLGLMVCAALPSLSPIYNNQSLRLRLPCVDESRTFLLAGAEVLIAVPFVMGWAVLFYSIAGQPSFRLWMRGGAVLGLLIPTVLGMMNLIDGLSLMALAVLCGHLGAILGHTMAKTPLAKWIDPQLSQSQETTATAAAETTAPDCKDKTAEHDATLTKALSKRLEPAHEATPLYIWSMAWQASYFAFVVSQNSVPFFSKPARERPIPALLVHVAILVTGVVLQACYARLYIASTKHLRWQSSCGFLCASVSLALLRVTSAYPTAWQSWTVDGLLTLLTFHIGLLVGYASGGE